MGITIIDKELGYIWYETNLLTVLTAFINMYLFIIAMNLFRSSTFSERYIYFDSRWLKMSHKLPLRTSTILSVDILLIPRMNDGIG